MTVDKLKKQLITVIEEVARVLSRSKHAVVFTGAGISAESGIPTFRGSGGLWAKYNAEEVASVDGFMKNPKAFWEFIKELVKNKSKPNSAHYAIAELEKLGIVRTVITQNIDMLHQRAGSEEVIELHGSMSTIKCLECGKTYDWKEIEPKLTDCPPVCECGSTYLKPAVVFFGEPLPEDAMARAVKHASSCDTFMVVGSSLVVYPAAYLPFVAKKSGATLIILNAEPTHADEYFDYVLHGKAGDILPRIAEAVSRFLTRA